MVFIYFYFLVLCFLPLTNDLLWIKIKQCMSVLVRVLQRNRTNKIYVYVYVCMYTYLLTYNELAHVIMEAGKFPQICRSIKLETQVQFCFKMLADLKPKKLMFSFQSRPEKTDVPAQGSQTGGVSSYLQEGQPFDSIQSFTQLYGAHSHEGEQSALLSLSIKMLVFIQKYSHRHTQGNV